VEGYKRVPRPIFVGFFAMMAVWGFWRWIGQGDEPQVNRVVIGFGGVLAVIVGSCLGLALCNHRMAGDLRPRDLLLFCEVGFVVCAALFNVLARSWFCELFHSGGTCREPMLDDFQWRASAAILVFVPLAVSWLPASLLSIEWAIRVERIMWALIALISLAVTVALSVWLIGIPLALPTALAFQNVKRHQLKRNARYNAIRGSEWVGTA
jgi:ABC-type Fe3+-siderophore transport system permease subunit